MTVEGMPERRFPCPAREVTLMEDRARVLRRGRMSLFASRLRLRIPEVSTALVDKTLKATLRGPGGELPIHQIAVRRKRITREAAGAPPDAMQELKRARDALLRESGRITEARAREDAHLAHLKELSAHLLEEIQEDASWGRGEPERWQRALRDIAERRDQALAERHRLSVELEELGAERSRIDAQISAATDPPKERIAWIELECEVPEEGEHELELEYLVPGACWRPAHRAEIVEAGDGARLRWRAEACIWQNTGERWEEVAIACSTQRPSLGVEPPALATDRLAVRRKREVLEVQVREQTVATTGLGAGPSSQKGPGGREEPEEIPGIDDGGEALALRASSPATIAGDGRPHRVPLFELESAVELSQICAPELSLAILRKSVQTNAGERPLLAGPVDLIREGGFVGRSKVGFVAPGERFELGWGPEGALRVEREKEELKSDSSFFGSWTTRVFRVRLRLSNIGGEAQTLRLTERVPVSEIEKVQIQVDEAKTYEGRGADADGFLRWVIELPPKSHKTVDLRYSVKQHADVVGVIG